MDFDRVICFDEPHHTKGNARVTLTVRQALDYIRKIHGRSYVDLMGNEERLLEDFMAVNWAWYE